MIDDDLDMPRRYRVPEIVPRRPALVILTLLFIIGAGLLSLIIGVTAFFGGLIYYEIGERFGFGVIVGSLLLANTAFCGWAMLGIFDRSRRAWRAILWVSVAWLVILAVNAWRLKTLDSIALTIVPVIIAGILWRHQAYFVRK